METEEKSREHANKPKRDWFGYTFTAVVGIVTTLLVAWYQIYSSDKEIAAAESERAKSVKQAAVAIVEESVLNGKKLEIDRLARLIDQRRRDEQISFPIAVSEVVEQAEFNISASRYISIDRKEEMKPIFDDFYSNIRQRSYRPFPAGRDSSDLLNEIAKKIQSGHAAEALAALRRLDEVHEKELVQTQKNARTSLGEVITRVLSSPTKTSVLIVAFSIYFAAAFLMLRFIRERRIIVYRRKRRE